MDRLQKIIASAGICSRRKAEDLIKQGHVTVNHRPAQIGQSADPNIDEIRVRGELINPSKYLVYYALNKPKGFISTAQDEKGRKTVLDLLPKEPRVFPIGRLDRESEGLLLLTNDGAFAQKIAHPKNVIQKTYEVVLDRKLSSMDLEKLKAGVKIEYKKIKPDNVRYTQDGLLIITIHSGQNRIIRRMMASLGYTVKKLTRTSIGALQLGKIKKGQYKELNKKQLALLDQKK